MELTNDTTKGLHKVKDIYSRINHKILQHPVLLTITTSTSPGTSTLGTTWSKRSLRGKTCCLERPELLSQGNADIGSVFRTLSNNTSINIKLLLMSSCLVTTSKATSTVRESPVNTLSLFLPQTDSLHHWYQFSCWTVWLISI